MEALPTELELRSYTFGGLQSAIEQHETNIATYEDVIANERKRIDWLRAVIKAKQEFEDASVQLDPS